MAATDEGFVLKPTLWVIKFPTTSFQTFSAGMKKQFDEESIAKLDTVSKAREAFDATIRQTPPSFEAQIKCAELYMPHVCGLNLAIGRAATTTFPWRSGLGKRAPTHNASINDETAFTHLALAFALHNRAAELIANTPMVSHEAFAGPSTEAAQLLCRAAGLLIAADEMLGTAEGHRATADFTECHAACIRGLQAMFLAEAQCIAVAKASLKQTSPGLLSKLLIDASAQMQQAADELLSFDGGGLEVEPCLWTYLKMTPPLLRSRSHKFAALHEFKELNYGTALGHMELAIEAIQQAETARRAAWASYLKGTAAESIAEELAELPQLQKKIADENERIGHEQVAGRDHLTIEAKRLSKPTPWVAPEPTFTNLVLKPDEPGACCTM